MSIAGIALALSLLIYLAYRGISVLVLALASASLAQEPKLAPQSASIL